MNKDLSAQAGKATAGKEEERAEEELSVRARAAKLSLEIKKKRLAEAAERDAELVGDECVIDTLARFGIKI
jgi:hypothetical protein